MADSYPTTCLCPTGNLVSTRPLLLCQPPANHGNRPRDIPRHPPVPAAALPGVALGLAGHFVNAFRVERDLQLIQEEAVYCKADSGKIAAGKVAVDERDGLAARRLNPSPAAVCCALPIARA